MVPHLSRRHSRVRPGPIKIRSQLAAKIGHPPSAKARPSPRPSLLATRTHGVDDVWTMGLEPNIQDHN
jgi:hypothetical protein